MKAVPPLAGDDDEDLSDASTPAQGQSGLSFVKEPSVIEQKAYRDTWGKGLDSYLKWFYETVVLLRELLADDGSLYVHLDYHVGHYAKAVLDEVLGADNFRNEIVWQKIRSSKAQSTRYGNVHDIIFFYSKAQNNVFYPPRTKHSDELIQSHYRNVEEGTGRKYMLDNFTQAGQGPARQFGSKTLDPPPGKHWIWSQERVNEGMEKGLIVFPKEGMPRVKRYLDAVEGNFVEDIWSDLAPVNSMSGERLDYPTQKPEALLERIIKASSNPGDLVLDCFCGSGTTAAVAEKLGRRWITCDLGRFAIHTARKRLLGIEGVKPFTVQNLGKYERQAWQAAEFGEDAAALTQSYRDFILALYRAKPLHGYAWLHGVKNGRMVYVGGVDSPVSTQDVAQITAEFHRLTGTGKDAPTQSSVDILGWDFAFEINEVARQQAAGVGIDVHFIRIPREVLERKAVEQGDIKFFELAALSVDVTPSGRGVTLALKDFVIPLDDVPQEVQAAITHWEQWIDYWAVDWDNKGDAFHNQWQSYRTRKDKTLQRQIVSPPGTYKEPGEYKVVVKVIDILGNDTTKTVKVQVE